MVGTAVGSCANVVGIAVGMCIGGGGDAGGRVGIVMVAGGGLRLLCTTVSLSLILDRMLKGLLALVTR